MIIQRPVHLEEALERLAADPGLTPIAGGTDLLVSWHHRPHDDLRLLDLSQIGALAALRLDADWLELGALATYWQVMTSPAICAEFPLLYQAARQVGAVQIQTRGTWAGNIANGSPAADGVPVLMAYDARAVLRSKAGVFETPLDQYFTGYKKSVRRPDQLITAIRLPRRKRAAPGGRSVEWFQKVGARCAQAITKVGVAVVHNGDGWRIVANSVAPVVRRCRNLENALNGGAQFASPEEIRDVLKSDITPIDDMRSTAEYRSAVLSRVLYFGLQAERGSR